MHPDQIEPAMRAVGALLFTTGERYRVVVIGGAALNLLGIVSRATRDVDIVALATDDAHLELTRPQDELPAPLDRAARIVAGDLALPPSWLNCGPAAQWDVGLPPGFAERVHWKVFPGLDVGVADRLDLVAMKIEAAADQPDANNRHFRDLLALRPTDAEFAHAAAWLRRTNAGDAYFTLLDQVESHVRIRLAADAG